MRNNTKTNNLIRDLVVVGDFLALSLLFYFFVTWGPGYAKAEGISPILLWLISVASLMVAEWFFPTVIHRRRISSERVLRQVTMLVVTQCLMSYLFSKTGFMLAHRQSPHSLFYLELTYGLYPLLLVMRYFERWAVKRYRKRGGNTRTVLLVGSDPALVPVYKFLVSDPTTGYRVLGYYANHELQDNKSEKDGKKSDVTDKHSISNLSHLGTLAELQQQIEKVGMDGFHPSGSDNRQKDFIPDEIYCSLSWTKRDDIYRLIRFCNHHVIHFYFVPVFAESFGHSLKIEQIGETVGFTPYTEPLQIPANRLAKRVFDVLFSLFVLLCLLPLIPIIALIIKIQSPGPIFFKQLRTGMNGRNFYCYKFRSMHVNKDADRVQATRDDPRKFPFGNFMRRANIDELPQFLNVLRGDMSIVGPRPHMLAHTEQYSRLIDKYMVRHFVKPGVTGWAQVTGFRGETQELWQMEGRVRRDIWYIENWSVWLDLRIIWLTAKQIVVHDEQAY